METSSEADLLEKIHAAAVRSLEIRQAAAAYPGWGIGAAYKKWKEGKGETAALLHTTQNQAKQKEILAAINKLCSRPCSRPGCAGVQNLTSICGSCTEGKAGYKTKWTCNTCMTRDLSKEDMAAWLQKLSSE